MLRKGPICLSSLTPINLHENDAIVWTGTARDLLDAQDKNDDEDMASMEGAIVSCIINHSYRSLGDGYGVSPVRLVLGDVASRDYN